MKYIATILILALWGCESSSTEDAPTLPDPMNQPPPAQRPSTPMEMPPRMGTHETEPEREPAPMPSARAVDGHWSGPQGAELSPEIVIEPDSRARRRMNLDQLENSFLRVSDGLNWTEGTGANERSLFQTLSATLGKPDYVQITTEVLEPTALFQKFLGDAARQVCAKMVERDEERPSEATTVLYSEDSEAVDEHLQALILKFHSRELGPESRDLAQWRWLLDSVVFMTDTPAERWNAICVALFIHPDFYSY